MDASSDRIETDVDHLSELPVTILRDIIQGMKLRNRSNYPPSMKGKSMTAWYNLNKSQCVAILREFAAMSLKSYSGLKEACGYRPLEFGDLNTLAMPWKVRKHILKQDTIDGRSSEAVKQKSRERINMMHWKRKKSGEDHYTHTMTSFPLTASTVTNSGDRVTGWEGQSYVQLGGSDREEEYKEGGGSGKEDEDEDENV